MFYVYSKTDCGYCVRAKDHLELLNEEYVTKDITDPNVMAELMERMPSARTVPQIWKDEEYIGGYTELAKKY